MTFVHRRRFVAAGATALALPSIVLPQPRKVWRVGFLWQSSRASDQADVDAILRRLRDLGFTEGKDFIPEYRWADGKAELLPKFAAELVKLNVDMIVTRSTPAALAVKAVTREIPVVFSMVSDPVDSALVNSLARPGGNFTGWSNMQPDTGGKLLEMLKAISPKMARPAVLADVGNRGKLLEIERLQQAAKALGLPIKTAALNTAGDIEGAFAQMPREGNDALVVLAGGPTLTHRGRIVELAAKYRLPAIYQVREFVESGGLISYGVSVRRQQERTAEYMGRIFRGAKPADLPVEQPTEFELVINRKTAKAMGFNIPQSLLIGAESVID